MGDVTKHRPDGDGPQPVRGWSVVDLFCGIGGLRHGLRRAGFDVAAGVDADRKGLLVRQSSHAHSNGPD